MISAFSKRFASINDPRQQAKVTYSLFDVIFLTLCSVITGAEGWEDIEDFGNLHLNWLQSKKLLPDGIPAHDTIARIIARLEPEEFNQCFINWMLDISHAFNSEIIAIDGKTLRSSYNRNDRKSCVHMVTAFATKNSLVLGQIKTNEKSNEITAIPKLLQQLDIKGCLITIDAMGCQKEIATNIVDNGGDYLLAVKRNQRKLHDAVKEQLSDVVLNTSSPMTVEEQHGRLDVREYYVLDAEKLSKQFPEWAGLKTVGVAIGFQSRGIDTTSLEFRYYISSASLTSEKFAQAVRNHWMIENQLHWVLDVTMNEDKCQIYKDNSAENLGVLRHAALNMLRSEKSENKSVRRKQRRAYADTAYLDKILGTQNEVAKS